MRFKSWTICANYGGIIDTIWCGYPMRYIDRFTLNCYIIIVDGFSHVVWVHKYIYALSSFDTYFVYVYFDITNG